MITVLKTSLWDFWPFRFMYSGDVVYTQGEHYVNPMMSWGAKFPMLAGLFKSTDKQQQKESTQTLLTPVSSFRKLNDNWLWTEKEESGQLMIDLKLLGRRNNVLFPWRFNPYQVLGPALTHTFIPNMLIRTETKTFWEKEPLLIVPLGLATEIQNRLCLFCDYWP